MDDNTDLQNKLLDYHGIKHIEYLPNEIKINHGRPLIQHQLMSSRPVQRILFPVLSFLFGPLLRPRARQLVTRAATPLLHKPSSTGVQPSPMSILRP